MKFGKGSLMFWKTNSFNEHRGKPAYEKLDDNDMGLWVSLTSTYIVKKSDEEFAEEVELNKKGLSPNGYLPSKYKAMPETDKPLWVVDEKGNKTLNRYGFKWTDAQVFEHYGLIMDFEIK